MTNNDSAFRKAQSFFDKIIAIAYPEGFAIGSAWKNRQEETRQRINSFKSFEEAVHYAQRGGFDHRMIDRNDAVAVANFKIQELERIFPAWGLKESSWAESAYSIEESLIKIDGKNYSSIFFTHLAYYLRSTEALAGKQPERILEIGGGYGALARIFKLANKTKTYVLVDLPESLFYAHAFLTLNFPDAKIGCISSDSPKELWSFDFLLVPVQWHKVLQDEKFDIVINTGSLQEMPAAAVSFWMNFIQNTIQPRLFYSFNYFLMNKKASMEASYHEANDICPVLDPWWKVRYFQINPNVLTIDADWRNWLEVCVERDQDRKSDIHKKASDLFSRANLFPKASNYWFADVWMSIWCDPKEKYIDEMMKGIEIFRNEIRAGVPRNYCRKHALSLKSKIKNHVKKIFLRKPQPPIDWNNFSEIDFYQALLERSQAG